MNDTTAAISVFFSPRQAAAASLVSPSAGKAEAVVASWRELGLPIAAGEPEPVTVDDFVLAHDQSFVEEVLACRRDNRFDNRCAQVAMVLPWTNGSLFLAARHVLAHGGVVAAPCSSFRHAGYDHPAGSCTFNGLMVIALKLKGERRVASIGILDRDQHCGDGTEEHIARHRASVWIKHVTASQDYPRRAEKRLAALPALVRKFKGCHVVHYQAGAVPHVNDPRGGFLDNVQLAPRDAIGVAEAHKLGMPMVWNLAGGYQSPLRLVLDIHDRTMIECVRAYLGERALPTAAGERRVHPRA